MIDLNEADGKIVDFIVLLSGRTIKNNAEIQQNGRTLIFACTYGKNNRECWVEALSRDGKLKAIYPYRAIAELYFLL